MLQDDSFTGGVIFPSSKWKQSIIERNEKLYEKKWWKCKVLEREKTWFHFAFLFPEDTSNDIHTIAYTPNNGNNGSNTSYCIQHL